MTRLLYNLKCAHSGLQIGQLEYEVVAGHMPYLSHWNGLVALHPVFSLPEVKLLAFARSEWNRLAKASEDKETSETEENLLRVCFLAVLHSLGSIHQEEASLPTIELVQNNMAKLFPLAYWKYYLNSKRFNFPDFKINRLNANNRFENINHYLDACYAIKEAYEAGLSDVIEKEKVDAADRALRALRDSWIVPVGNRKLWRWVRAHLSAKYEADATGWMSTLFLGNESTILDFDRDEIELMSEIIVSECPGGTAILKAVRDRLDKIMQVHTDNKEAFTVDFTEYLPDPIIDAMQSEAKQAPAKAPQRKDFATTASFIRANALFYLQTRAREQRAAGTEAAPAVSKMFAPIVYEDALF